MKKNKIQKIISVVLILANFLLNPGIVSAISVGSVSSMLGVPSPQELAKKMMEGVMKMMNVSQSSVQNFSQYFNVSAQKRDFPQVLMTFSPSNPKPGEKVTALASPEYFSVDNEQLYFTWYLKHNDGTGVKATDSNNLGIYMEDGNVNWSNPDNPNNQTINYEDYKIEAMRTIAQGGWEPNWRDLADKIGMKLSNLNAKNYKERMGLFYANATDTDNDGYRATLGGDKGKYKYCYVGDFDSGNMYEFVKSKDDGGTSGPTKDSGGNGTPTCLDSDGNAVADSEVRCVAGSGSPLVFLQNEDTSCQSGWNPWTPSDPSPSYPNAGCIDTDPAHIIPDGPCTLAAAPCSTLDTSITTGSGGPCTLATRTPIMTPYDLCGPEYTSPTCGSSGKVKCDSGRPMCVYKSTAKLLGACNDTKGGTEFTTVPILCDDINLSKVMETDATKNPYIATYDGSGNKNGSQEQNPNITVVDKLSCEKSTDEDNYKLPSHKPNITDTQEGCGHLFPNSNVNDTGNNNFDISEEEFWGTDPNNPSTAGNGKMDEANVVGLGQTEFSWNYQAGDEVGVAIEGPSMKPTKHDDSSMMIMWAMANNVQKDIKDSSKNPTNFCFSNYGPDIFYTESIKGFDVDIPTATNKLNSTECLKANLVDPAKGGQATKMNPVLSAIPENPIQDPEAIDTDTINVQASFENAESSASSMYYEWKIQHGTSISGSFTDTCDQDQWKEDKCKFGTESSKFTEINRLSGNNLSSISFKPNLPDGGTYFDSSGSDGSGIAYLKVHLDAYENFPGANNNTRVGRADIVIKLVKPAVKMEAFVPDATQPPGKENYELSIPTDTNADGTLKAKICDKDSSNTSEIQKYICFVTPNQIVGARIIDNTTNSSMTATNFKFSWMLNEKPLYFDSSFCPDASQPDHLDCLDGKIVYFPISSKVGDQYNLTVNLADEKTGKNIQMSKLFEVVEPYVKIVPFGEDTNGDGTISESEITPDVWAKYLGRYEDVNGACDKTVLPETKESCLKKFYDFSDSVFETNQTKVVKLRADFHPNWIAGDVNTYGGNTQWLLDGEEQDSQYSECEKITDTTEKNVCLNGINTMSFQAMNDIGEVNNVEFHAIYNQSPTMRKALNNIWGVSSFDSVESDLSATAQIEVVEEATVTKSNEEKAILASVFGNTSENIIFFLRLILTIALVIFVSGLAFSAAPRRQTYLR
jgi:hypothetical protein